MKTRNFKFKDFLKRSKIPIEIEDSIKYKRVKIRIKHGGVSLRDEELGKNIGTKKQFILKDGQFVLSKIDARYGAFGIADESVNNAIITGNFWAYDVDFNLIDIDWFNQLTNSQDFYDLCERSSTGITHRKYLNEAAFLNNEINLPSLEDQKKSVTRIENFKFNGNLNSTELKNQLSLISQLRQAFLKEAMQGKLVSNETSDGKTGADLLAEIQSEKQKLIKEKKIKKQKPLPPISEEEIPFNIPENWVWCRLGEIISDTEGGKSPNCENVAVKGDDWGVIKTTAIQENAFLDFENKKLPKGFQVKENYIVKLNDILITRAGPKNRVGILCLVEKNDYNLILSDKTIRMNVLKGKLNSKFITYALNSKTLKPFVESKMTGMADSQVNISQDNIKMIPIILPPLEIQNRIVSKLEELMTSCDDLETSVKESQNYNEQLLQQVQARLLWQAYQSFFAVIFWYFLLGPVAALSYRLLALAAEHSQQPALAERAAQLRHAFDWLPVRLLAASFALVGNFVAVSRVMLHELLNWNISAAQLIEKTGKVAGEIPAPVAGPEGINSLDQLWELLLRAAVVWYAGFALWTVLV